MARLTLDTTVVEGCVVKTSCAAGPTEITNVVLTAVASVGTWP